MSVSSYDNDDQVLIWLKQTFEDLHDKHHNITHNLVNQSGDNWVNK